MTLRDFFETIEAPRRKFGPATLRHYRNALNALDGFAGHPVELAELSDEFLSSFRERWQQSDRSQSTVGNRVIAIRTLWRRAADAGHVTMRPTCRSTAKRERSIATPRVKRRLRKLAMLIAKGKTLKVACRSVNVSYNTVLDSLDTHRELWKAERDRAMKLLLQDVRRRSEQVTQDANEQETFLADAARVDRWARKNGQPASGEGVEGTLRQYVSRYAMGRDIGEQTIDQLHYAVLCLDRWNGKPIMVADLNRDTANQWIAKRLADGFSRASMKVRRAAIITLWKSAHDEGLVASPPEKIRTVKVPRPIVDCWNEDQFAAILAEASKLTGDFRQCQIGRAALLRAILLAGYYTGLRPCDLLALPASPAIRSGQRFVVRQAKTSHQIVCVLPADAIEAIAATFPPEREILFPIDRKLYFQYVRDLAKRVGLKGSPKWVRRTGATLLEVSTPGAAMAHLGHLTPGLAYRHYVDTRQTQANRPLPPTPDQGGGSA